MDIATASTEAIRKDIARIRAESAVLNPELTKTEFGRLLIEAECRREDTKFMYRNGQTLTVFGTWAVTRPLDPHKVQLDPVVYYQVGSDWIRLS